MKLVPVSYMEFYLFTFEIQKLFILAPFILLKPAEILAGNMLHHFLYQLLSQQSSRPFQGLSHNLSGSWDFAQALKGSQLL